MDALEARMKRDIAPERRRQLEEYARFKGLSLTRQEVRQWNKDADDALVASCARTKPTAAQQKAAKELDDECWRECQRLKDLAPTIAIEVLYVERVKLRMQEAKTQDKEDVVAVGFAEAVAQAVHAAIEPRLSTHEESKRPDKAKAAGVKILPPAPKPDFVFERNGRDFWRIVFEGRELAPVRHLSGLTYISKLLAYPGGGVDCRDLYEAENPPPPNFRDGDGDGEPLAKIHGTGGRAQKLVDGVSAAKLKVAREALLSRIEDADDDERERLLEKLATVEKALRAAPCGTFERPERKRPRQAVTKAIDAALRAINAAGGAEAFKHLDLAVRRGAFCTYAGGLPWNTR